LILDTSAIVSIMFREQGFQDLLGKLIFAPHAGVSAPTLAETAIVVSSRRGKDTRGLLSRFIMESAVSIVPFGDAHYGTAVEAWLRFGKGRHPAGLNFGDCLSYATARLAGQPLLCTGEDFSKTDIEIA
jgi:ribonuclease VapC